MTTNIFSNLISPMCEFFYKKKRTYDLYQANINTIRNYGQSTSYSINFGFEVFQPLNLNSITLQPGVYTTSGILNVQPNLSISQQFNINNNIVIKDLGAISTTINYLNQTLPLKISISTISNTLTGIISSYATNGVPYKYNTNIDQSIVRKFEYDFSFDNTLTALVFVNLTNVYFQGVSTNWAVLPSSIYSAAIKSFRYNNGFGQFYAIPANSAFIPANISVDNSSLTEVYQSTYTFVYNFINKLSWNPNFKIWYQNYGNTLPQYLIQFINDYLPQN